MNAEPRNQEEPKDAHLSRLYRESDAPEPSMDVDRAILAAARREVHARPRRVGTWLREWRVPVSIAATLVVTASLVMVMVEERGNRIGEAPSGAPAPAAPVTDDLVVRSPSAATPEVSAERSREAPSQIASKHAESDSEAARQALKSSARRESASDARVLAETPRAQSAPPPLGLARPFPSDAPASSAPPRGDLEQRAVPGPETSAPRAAGIPLPDGGGEAPANRQSRRERTEDAGSGTLGASRPSLGVRGFVEDQTTDQVGAQPQSTPLGARGLNAPQQGEGRDRRLGPASPSQDAIGRAAPADPPKDGGPALHAQERRDAASGATAPPRAKRLPSTVQADPKPKLESRGLILARDLFDQPPEKWLERIEQLRREDRDGDADELLGEFRQRFPAHPAAQQAPER
jgi:hypothetical protein